MAFRRSRRDRKRRQDDLTLQHTYSREGDDAPLPYLDDAPWDSAAPNAWEEWSATAVWQEEPEAPVRATRRNGLWFLVVVICLGLLGGMCYVVFDAYQPNDTFELKLDWMKRDTFFDGVFVDGVHVGGMTMAQAEQALQMDGAAQHQGLDITLTVDKDTLKITNAQLPFERNTQAVLETAYAIGRQGFPWMLGSGHTPFETRFQHTQQTLRKQAHLSTQVTYDEAQLRALANSIAAERTRQPINAIIAEFDFQTRNFTVTQDVPGAVLNADLLFARLKAALDAGEYTARLAIETVPVLPTVTSVELKNGFARLASFTTNTTSDEKRNTNIRLAAQAISGTTLMPNETFSFNERVGERTAQKGYQMAPAIAGGTTFDEIGGGVCQVSSTLFNAVALSDMTIVSRSPHAWPSSYIDKGLDATVNWPNLDFVFRNNRETPVFLIAGYNKRKVTVEVYGMMKGPGESVALDTTLISTTKPPDEPTYQQNTSLPPGTQRVAKQARTGYVVDTYRVYLRNGREYRREKLFTSNYRMIPKTIEYN